MGDFTSEMEGAPQFHKGDQIVAFIARWYDGVPMVAGYAQGLVEGQPGSPRKRDSRGGAADGMPILELGRQLNRSGN